VRRQLKKPRDQALVSLLAYAGLRPGEALGLRWGDIGERTILVERAISHGEEKSTKTRATRSVRMVKPLKSELASRAAINARSASRSPPFRGTAARCCASTLRAARIAHMNLLVVKFDGTGRLGWRAALAGTNVDGGVATDRGFSVVETADGGFAVAGSWDATTFAGTATARCC